MIYIFIQYILAMLRREHIWVIVLVLCVLSINVIPRQLEDEEDDIWTLREAYYNEIREKDERKPVDNYKIKDRVNETISIKIPGIYHYKDEDGDERVGYDLNETTYLTGVRFGSLGDYFTYFKGNRTFEVGEENKFTMEKEGYPFNYLYPRYLPEETIEPVYYNSIMMDYSMFVPRTIFNTTFERDFYRNNGSFRFEVKFNEIHDFFPSDVPMSKANFSRIVDMREDFTNFSAKIYDAEGEVVEDIDDGKLDSDRRFHEGDRIVVEGKYCYKTSCRIKFYISFEAHNDESYRFFFSDYYYL